MSVDFDDFERRYRSSADPWHFEASAYERARYATTIAWLESRHFARGFEPACSIGVLTALLAGHCDELIACDVSATACATARRRVAGAEHVRIVEAGVPAWWPDGTFDLIVLSELGYYWDPDGVEALAQRAASALVPGGTVVAVHWLGRSPDHRQHGSAVHDQLESVFGDPQERRDVDPIGDADPSSTFVIERWRRP